jgi:hypothetical protein
MAYMDSNADFAGDIQELTLDEIEFIDGGKLSVNEVLLYGLAGAAGIAVGGPAAFAGGFLLFAAGVVALV